MFNNSCMYKCVLVSVYFCEYMHALACIGIVGMYCYIHIYIGMYCYILAYTGKC